MKVLDSLGLLDAALEYGQKIDRLYGYTDRSLLKPWKFTQDQIKHKVLDLEYKYLGEHFFGLGIHRGTLFQILHDAVLKQSPQISVKCGFNISRVEEREVLDSNGRRGVKCRLFFQNNHQDGSVMVHLSFGSTKGSNNGGYEKHNSLVVDEKKEEEEIDTDYDLVVIASGTHSRLGNFEKRNAKLYEFGSLWANAVDTCDFTSNQTLLQKYRNAQYMSGLLPIGKLMNHHSQDRNNSMTPCNNQHHRDHQDRHHEKPLVSIFWSLTQQDYLKFKSMSSNGADFQQFKESLIEFWPQLSPFISQIQNKEEFTYATYNDVQMHPRDWLSEKGGVVMIGDYCHGTSPQLGQGAGRFLWYRTNAIECFMFSV